MIHGSAAMAGAQFVLVTRRKDRVAHRRRSRSRDDCPVTGAGHIDLRGRRRRCGLSRAKRSRARPPPLWGRRCRCLGRTVARAGDIELDETQFICWQIRVGLDIVGTTRLGRSGREGRRYQGGQDRLGDDDDRRSSCRCRSHLSPASYLLGSTFDGPPLACEGCSALRNLTTTKRAISALHVMQACSAFSREGIAAVSARRFTVFG
jgi:hypothetical protein